MEDVLLKIVADTVKLVVLMYTGELCYGTRLFLVHFYIVSWLSGIGKLLMLYLKYYCSVL